MRALRSALSRVFNWRRHPGGVFFLALPLALIGFLALGARAALAIVWHGDWGFLAIFMAGLALLAFGLWPIRRELARLIRGH